MRDSKCVQADGGHLPLVEDGNLDAVGESIQGDVETPFSFRKLGESLTAHVLRGFRQPIASGLVETRLGGLKTHSAADGSGQAQVLVQMKLDAVELSGHIPRRHEYRTLPGNRDSSTGHPCRDGCPPR